MWDHVYADGDDKYIKLIEGLFNPLSEMYTDV